MLYLYFSMAVFILWIFCLVDVLTTAESDCRNLPRIAWLVIVFLFMLVGSVCWLAFGRPNRGAGHVIGRLRTASVHERRAPEFPEYDRPGRFSSENPESDAEFLRRCRERAEEQRRKARENDA
ncbi:PLD nuclease N-terminal domain-containing protein [Pseudonocardia spinosispora]|uniref:PLD nuclease N-terminal domain-containing protein n=1 Tax=Pseudonocardia spinosispora TaxID=103441 RepID=UPI0004197F7A|nr:PLD nuclease N-terminal domain-containing protein [Pseudonocardia spinosispora]